MAYNELQSIFAKHFVRSATLCSIDCACGRTHFVSCQGKGDYEEGELQRLQQLAAEQPTKYVECTEYDHIDCAYIGGKSVVLDCPCKTADKYAAFLSAHAEDCARFLIHLLTERAKWCSEKERKCLELADKLSLWPSN